MAQKSTVVRLSLRWLLLAIASMVLLGILGGTIALRLNSRPTPLLPERDQLITTVQEVTLSPSQNAQATVAEHERSVVLLAHGSRSNPSILGAAAVVTNDGVLAGVHAPTRDEVFGIDNTGTYLALQAIGRDTLYGISFYRLRDGVLAPLEISTTDPDVGASMLAVSRTPGTAQPVAHTYALEQYTPPNETDPAAWHRIARLIPDVSLLVGSPLLSDNGQTLGVIVNDSRAIPASYVRRSLERLAAGKREDDPFARLGFTIRPAFRVDQDATAVTFSFVVQTVDSAGPSRSLRVGDSIRAINNQELTWQANIIDLLSVTPPITVTVERAGSTQDVTVGPSS